MRVVGRMLALHPAPLKSIKESERHEVHGACRNPNCNCSRSSAASLPPSARLSKRIGANPAVKGGPCSLSYLSSLIYGARPTSPALYKGGIFTWSERLC